MATPQEEAALATTAKGAPVTFERPLRTDLEFEKPYLSRALAAVDSEHPYGTEGYPNNDLTVLQQHVDFFDSNHDGLIYPWDTYTGFRRIGFNPIVSLFTAFVINGAFSYVTVPGWLPSPFFAIYTRNIHKAKHGSDSETYDTEGRFVPAKFEEVFSKYAKTYPDRMSFGELFAMTNAMRNAMDVFGWSVIAALCILSSMFIVLAAEGLANKFEWGFLYWLVKDEAGFASKEAIRGVFDGSFFVYVENNLNAKKVQKEKKV